MSDERLTCLVPTHNRPQFLRRLLQFYSQFPPDFSFLVVDSSNPSVAAENLDVIESWKSAVSVEYRHFDSNFIDKCVRGLEQVRTSFVAFCGDDDLLFPNAVQQCVEFLGNAAGYSAAMGRTVQLSPTRPAWRGRVLQVLKGYSIEHDRPLDRCRQMATQLFSSFYAVYRTETLLDNFQITAANSDSQLTLLAPEMLLSQLSVLRGRIKVLPVMYSIRERHETNAGFSVRTGVQPKAEPLYQRFRKCLADQLIQAGIDRAESERFIDDKFGFLRDPRFGSRRRRRSIIQTVRQLFHGIAERAVDHFWTDRARHSRGLQASDVAGCEPVWNAAVQLIREFPLGISAGDSALKRSA